MHPSTNIDMQPLCTDSNAAFLFTLLPSFPVDIFARCHLWNTVETQRDVSWVCLTLQAVGRLIKARGTVWSLLPLLTDCCCWLEGSGSRGHTSWFLQMLLSLDITARVSTRTIKLFLKVPAAAVSTYGEEIQYNKSLQGFQTVKVNVFWLP